MNNLPLVTAIMPTRGRAEMAKHALESFISQTYDNKRLVVLDDEDNPSFPDGIHLPCVSYFIEAERKNIPSKRNACCNLADDGIIMHFDSDDWSAPGRMSDQVERLLSTGKPFTGYSSMLFYDEDKKLLYRYSGRKSYAIGTSFAFLKSFWMTSRFDERHDLSSDNRILGLVGGEIVTADAGDFMVARIHSGNSNPKRPHSPFVRVPIDKLPSQFPRVKT